MVTGIIGFTLGVCVGFFLSCVMVSVGKVNKELEENREKYEEREL